MARAYQLDDTDRIILDALQEDSRKKAPELREILDGSGIELKEGAINNRIERLRKEGFIQKFVAILDPRKFQCPQLSFLSVHLRDKSEDTVKKFIEVASNNPAVMEIYATVGSIDYLIKTRTTTLEEAVQLSRQLGYLGADVQTLGVAEVHKETTALRVQVAGNHLGSNKGRSES